MMLSGAGSNWATGDVCDELICSVSKRYLLLNDRLEPMLEFVLEQIG